MTRQTDEMFHPTIGEVPIHCFAKEPTGREMANVIARWANDEIAAFLCDLGELVHFRDGSGHRPRAIGIALVEQEEREMDGSGSRLIEGVASAIRSVRSGERIVEPTTGNA